MINRIVASFKSLVRVRSILAVVMFVSVFAVTLQGGNHSRADSITSTSKALSEDSQSVIKVIPRVDVTSARVGQIVARGNLLNGRCVMPQVNIEMKVLSRTFRKLSYKTTVDCSLVVSDVKSGMSAGCASYL